jgi:hypothetical protein
MLASAALTAEIMASRSSNAEFVNPNDTSNATLLNSPHTTVVVVVVDVVDVELLTSVALLVVVVVVETVDVVDVDVVDPLEEEVEVVEISDAVVELDVKSTDVLPAVVVVVVAVDDSNLDVVDDVLPPVVDDVSVIAVGAAGVVPVTSGIVPVDPIVEVASVLVGENEAATAHPISICEKSNHDVDV